MEKTKVGIVGYGTIGKRVADAVMLQPDIELVGVTANSYNYRIETAQNKGIPVYALGETKYLEESGIILKGHLRDLLKKCDIVVDCSPKPFGLQNKEIYITAGVKAIFQGGEKAHVGEVSFVAQCNYLEAMNKDYVRVVSCNTTGLGRTIIAIDNLYGVEKVRACLIRRASDPGGIKKGPVNAIIPCMEMPSHHGPDVLTVIPGIDIFTTAVIVPTTIMHVHNLSIKVKKKPDLDEIKQAFDANPRIRLVKAKQKVLSTACIAEMARDEGKLRGDMMEICIWEESIATNGEEVHFMQAVHQESDVVPENIDAIRALIGKMNSEESMRITNQTLLGS